MTGPDAFDAARRRERETMRVLAESIVHGFAPPTSASPDDLRQLGYAAQLARGRAEDPQRRLLEIVKFCRNAVSDAPVPDVAARDPLQAEWGARWPLDAAKLRTELPLHVLRARAAQTRP